jgi:hypothetical protein
MRLLLVCVAVLMVATIVVAVAADPIHVPGGPRLRDGGEVGRVVATPQLLSDNFSPIHVPGGP